MKEGEMSHWSKQEDKTALEEKSELHNDCALRQFSVSPTKHRHKENSFCGLQWLNNVEVRSFSMRVIVYMNNKISTNTDTQMCTVHCPHSILFCIIHNICYGASFASWDCKSNQQPSHKTCTSLHLYLPEMKQNSIHNKVKTPESKWDIVSQLTLQYNKKYNKWKLEMTLAVK